MRIIRTQLSILLLLASGLSQAQQCVEDSWEYLGDNSIYAKEFGTLQPGVVITYGVNQENGVTILPKCPVLSPAGQPIRIPVFLVDFHDYVPGVDLSNPNNPDSDELPGYVKQTPQQVSDYLNGPDGPAQYFDDVSGGQLQLEFDVHGWIVSSDTGYLKGRDSYMSFLNGSWRCDREGIMRDLIRESIVTLGVDWTQYDVEAGNHANILKNADGAVLLYEGQAGLCNGTNMGWLSGSWLGQEDTGSGFYGYFAEDIRELVDDTDPNKALFTAQPVLLNYFNNIPETSVSRPATGTWVHELGHLFLGFSDYYDNKYNVQGWALSGAIGLDAFHPSAYEKWLLGGWLEPESPPDFGVLELAANQHPDGGFDANAPYLYKFDIDSVDTQYLTFEYHWFEEHGNTQTKWATNRYSSDPPKESGILINAFDWTRTVFDAEPQIRRFLRDGVDPIDFMSRAEAFTPGESFDYCYSGTRCVHIAVLSLNGNSASVFFSDHDNGFDDYDRDGTVNAIDAFVYDASESVDTDGDGVGNNADLDDDGDGMPDAFENQYGFDPLSAADAGADADGDGATNLEEFNNGTDPTVADVAPPPPPPAPAASSGGGGSMQLLFLLALLAHATLRRSTAHQSAGRVAETPALGGHDQILAKIGATTFHDSYSWWGQSGSIRRSATSRYRMPFRFRE